tara:strand:+ start:6831 stop:7874 length:1044 start_codon:yes stop_codon:yes gene_type:complete
MAINTSAHNPKEYQVLVAEETTVGTANGTGSDYVAIETESISMPTFNDLRVIEQRSGTTGRVVNQNDLLSHEEGAVHEFSVSGVWTNDLAKILLENALGVEVSSNFITLASGYEHAAFGEGDTSSGAHNTICFHINGLADADTSATGNSYSIPGCVITSLKLSANSQENGGRINFELTAQTRQTISLAGAAKVTGFTDFTTNYKYLSTFTEVKKVAGADCILDSWELSIENPVAFLGNKTKSGFEGTPEKYLRGIPNLDITSACVVKYDDNTDQFFQSAKELTPVTSNGLFLSNNGTFASADDLGFDMTACVITECAFDEGDYLKLSLTLKMIDKLSGNLIKVRPQS